MNPNNPQYSPAPTQPGAQPYPSQGLPPPVAQPQQYGQPTYAAAPPMQPQYLQPTAPQTTFPQPVMPAAYQQQQAYPAPGPTVLPPQQTAAQVGGSATSGSTVSAPKTNPNSTQNTLQIAEIRDGIVIMNDGSYRSVVMVKSINFDLMSGSEQEAVEYSYQGFLNSLYFPIQIFHREARQDTYRA
jgi:hypothetical protein